MFFVVVGVVGLFVGVGGVCVGDNIGDIGDVAVAVASVDVVAVVGGGGPVYAVLFLWVHLTSAVVIIMVIVHHSSSGRPTTRQANPTNE